MDKKRDRFASIIISNWNGKEMLSECIGSVCEAVNSDGAGHEIIVVDDASCDGSAEFVQSSFPKVRVIALKENKRFALANNIAAREAKNCFLIFLNNDILVDKGFLRPLLSCLDNNDVFAASPRIVMQPQWDGRFRVKETGLTRGNFRKGNFEIWQEESDDSRKATILYASGSAMACSKEKFFALGGFDPIFGPFYYEDTDLSYRAWKRGWQVIYEPKSLVHHKYRRTNNCVNFNPRFINRILQRNKIIFTLKNVTEAQLLLRYFLRLISELLTSLFFLNTNYVFSFLCAINRLPAILQKKAKEAKYVRFSDSRVFELTKNYSPASVIKGCKRKALILGASPLPFENEKKVYASCIRTWNLVKPLLEDGHEIFLIGSRIKGTYKQEESLPSIIESKKESFTYYSVGESLFWENGFLQSIHDDFKPDCVIGINTQPAGRAAILNSDKPLWLDLNGFCMAEAQAKAYVYDDNTYLNDFWRYEKAALKRADMFSVVSMPQKFALIGELAASGRLNKFSFGYEFIHCLPNSIDESEYVHKKTVIRQGVVSSEDFVILWCGSYNTWTDIDTLFTALEYSMQQNDKIRFVSIGGKVEGHDEKTFDRFRAKVASSKLQKRFIFHEWVPCEEVPNYYFESNVGINIDKFNYETLLGARTRILDMLKAGLPVVTSLGTEVSYLIRNEKLGFVYSMGDAKGLSSLILSLAKTRHTLKEYGQRARDYAFKNLTAKMVTLPLREWVKDPAASPDRGKALTLNGNSHANNFHKYIAYLRTEGYSGANRRAARFLLKKINL
ncbi:MAG: glycosyltransferase [Candidatus Omnitrophota bacterium]